jgi:hypothetical protein
MTAAGCAASAPAETGVAGVVVVCAADSDAGRSWLPESAVVSVGVAGPAGAIGATATAGVAVVPTAPAGLSAETVAAATPGSFWAAPVLAGASVGAVVVLFGVLTAGAVAEPVVVGFAGTVGATLGVEIASGVTARSTVPVCAVAATGGASATTGALAGVVAVAGAAGATGVVLSVGMVPVPGTAGAVAATDAGCTTGVATMPASSAAKASAAPVGTVSWPACCESWDEAGFAPWTGVLESMGAVSMISHLLSSGVVVMPQAILRPPANCPA